MSRRLKVAMFDGWRGGLNVLPPWAERHAAEVGGSQVRDGSLLVPVPTFGLKRISRIWIAVGAAIRLDPSGALVVEGDKQRAGRGVFDIFVALPRPAFEEPEALDGWPHLDVFITFAAAEITAAWMAEIAADAHADALRTCTQNEKNRQFQFVRRDMASRRAATLQLTRDLVAAAVNRISDRNLIRMKLARRETKQERKDGKDQRRNSRPYGTRCWPLETA